MGVERVNVVGLVSGMSDVAPAEGSSEGKDESPISVDELVDVSTEVSEEEVVTVDPASVSLVPLPLSRDSTVSSVSLSTLGGAVAKLGETVGVWTGPGRGEKQSAGEGGVTCRLGNTLVVSIGSGVVTGVGLSGRETTDMDDSIPDEDRVATASEGETATAVPFSVALDTKLTEVTVPTGRMVTPSSFPTADS